MISLISLYGLDPWLLLSALAICRCFGGIALDRVCWGVVSNRCSRSRFTDRTGLRVGRRCDAPAGAELPAGFHSCLGTAPPPRATRAAGGDAPPTRCGREEDGACHLADGREGPGGSGIPSNCLAGSGGLTLIDVILFWEGGLGEL